MGNAVRRGASLVGDCWGLSGVVEELGWISEPLLSGAVWEPAGEVIAWASWNYCRERPVQGEVDDTLVHQCEGLASEGQ